MASLERLVQMHPSNDELDQSYLRHSGGSAGDQLTLIAELGRRALTDISPAELMSESVRLATECLRAEYGGVLELLPDGKAKFQAGVGWKEELVGQHTMELHDRFASGQVVLTQSPVVIDDLRTEGRFPGPSLLHDHNVVSSLNVPIHGRTRPLGVLGIHTRKLRHFTTADVSFLQAVANVLSAAMERQWLEKQERERYMGRVEQMMALGQVAAGVAHEIRNPLTSIKGLIQLNLRKAKASGLPPGHLEVIEQEIRRMERTLHVFLDFARPPEPERRPLILADVVDRVFAVVKGRAKKHRVSLRLFQPDEPVWIDGDQDQLQQLLLNLVLNSLDVMPRGGAVEIDLRTPRDGHVELFVRDTGPGIAAHILPKVFETFVSNKETGVGLGLPVSRRIAEDHGGNLSAYNLPGGGACFLLRLPARP